MSSRRPDRRWGARLAPLGLLAASALGLAGCSLHGSWFFEVGVGVYAGLGDQVPPLMGGVTVAVGGFGDDRSGVRWAVGGGTTATLFHAEPGTEADSLAVGPVLARIDVTHPGWDPARTGVFRYTAALEFPGALLAHDPQGTEVTGGVGMYGGVTWGWVAEDGTSFLMSGGPYGAVTGNPAGMFGLQTRITLSLAD